MEVESGAALVGYLMEKWRKENVLSKEAGSKVKGRWVLYPLGKAEHVSNHREMDLHTSVRLWSCFVLEKEEL